MRKILLCLRPHCFGIGFQGKPKMIIKHQFPSGIVRNIRFINPWEHILQLILTYLVLTTHKLRYSVIICSSNPSTTKWCSPSAVKRPVKIMVLLVWVNKSASRIASTSRSKIGATSWTTNATIPRWDVWT